MAKLDLPAAQFDMFEPWFAAMTLSVAPLIKFGYDPEQVAEKQLTNAAKAECKPISGLETIDQQIGYFDTLPEFSHIAFLHEAVTDIDTLGSTTAVPGDRGSKGDPGAQRPTKNESRDGAADQASGRRVDHHDTCA